MAAAATVMAASLGLAGCSDAANESPGTAADDVSIAQVAGYYAADLQAAERVAISATGTSAAASPSYHYAGLRGQYEADAAAVNASSAVRMSESTVTVRGFQKVGDEAAGLVADIELQFDRTYVAADAATSAESVESGEVITHRVVINPNTAQIVSVEKHDTEWLHSQHPDGEATLGPQPLIPTPTSTP
ncbi:hypothetical protein JT358_15610 [Micrococcales bacterium 31B]|nr:hypothetical protein [Micrococcales bacterium 31B]